MLLVTTLSIYIFSKDLGSMGMGMQMPGFLFPTSFHERTFTGI
jgi:hypothetical protein